MTQSERLVFLINAFKEEEAEYRDIAIPEDINERRRILRSLMNVRMPKETDEHVLAVQDEYLKERIKENGIVERCCGDAYK